VLALGADLLSATAPAALAMPNPASVYCIERGGKSIIVEGEGGQFGVCELPNGTFVEEWYLYRQSH